MYPTNKKEKTFQRISKNYKNFLTNYFAMSVHHSVFTVDQDQKHEDISLSVTDTFGVYQL